MTVADYLRIAPGQNVSSSIEQASPAEFAVLAALNPMIDVSVIIVTHNKRDNLRACLVSLEDMVSRVNVQTIVVDNKSSDGTVEMIASTFPDVHVLLNGKREGFAAATNQGLSKARGRYLLVLSSSALLGPGTLDTMVRYMDVHQHVGAAGPRVINRDGSQQQSVLPFPKLSRDTLTALQVRALAVKVGLINADTARFEPIADAVAREVDCVSSACVLIRLQALSDSGLLDMGYVEIGEDIELCWRLRQCGWMTIYLPKAEIGHSDTIDRSRHSAQGLIWHFNGTRRFYKLHRSRVCLTALRLVQALEAVIAISLLLTRRQASDRSFLSAYGRILANAVRG